MATQICSDCKKVKEYTCIYFHSRSGGKLRKQCKECINTKRKKARNSSRTQRQNSVKQGVKECIKCTQHLPLSDFWKNSFKCKYCTTLQMKKWRKENKAYLKAYNAMKTYNISEKQYHNLMVIPNCALCDTSFALLTINKEPRNIDHCHTSGKVRGVLCSRCNTGLGKFNDNIDLIKNALKYLKNA